MPLVVPAQLMNGGTPDWSTLATMKERFYLMVTNPWWVKEARTFATGHAGGNKVVMYQNGVNTRAETSVVNDGSGIRVSASGVSVAEADKARAAGDDWYLHRPDGSIQLSTWGKPVLNPAKPGFQKLWADNVIYRVTKLGFHGVFIDDINLKCNCSGGLPRELPTDTAWRQAMDSFVNYTAQRLRAAGISQIFPNIGNWLSDMDRGCRWANAYGGAFEEHFAQFGDFNSHRRRVDCSAVHGRFFGSTTDPALVPYAAGLALLFGYPGRTRVGIAAADDHNHFQWSTLFDQMVKLTQPTNTAYALSDGRWRRDFTNGYVVVSPSARTAQFVVR